MKKKLKKAIKSVDQFGVPIQLNFEGQVTYTSMLGGGCTILVLVLTILLIFETINQFYNKEDIQVQINSEFNVSPLPLTLHSSNFIFAIKVNQANDSDYLKSPYFNVQVTQYNLTKQNGKPNSNSTLIQMEPCTIEYFQNIKSNYIESSFTQNQLSTYLCPTINTTILLQGAYLNDDLFSYLKFTVEPCIGFTNQSNWNVSCASEEEVKNYYEQNGQFQLVLYTSNFVLNPQLPDNYSQVYLQEDLVFTFQPKQLIQNINVYFKEEIITTDRNQIIPGEIIQERFISRMDQYQYQVDLYSVNSKQQSPINIYFRSHNFRIKTERSFMKIEKVLSTLNGNLTILAVIVGYFMKIYNSTCYKAKIANNLYQLVDQPKPIHPNTQDNHHRKNNINEAALLPKKFTHSILQSHFSKVFLQIVDKISIKPKLSYWIHSFTNLKQLNSNKHKLLNQGIDQVNQNMDIRQVIMKLKEFERLKSLVLNNDQLTLFEFSNTRTQIQLTESIIQSQVISQSTSTQLRMSLVNAVTGAYLKLYEQDRTCNQMEDNISQKLMNLFDILIQDRQSEIAISNDDPILPIQNQQHGYLIQACPDSMIPSFPRLN